MRKVIAFAIALVLGIGMMLLVSSFTESDTYDREIVSSDGAASKMASYHIKSKGWPLIYSESSTCNGFCSENTSLSSVNLKDTDFNIVNFIIDYALFVTVAFAIILIQYRRQTE